VQFGISRRQGRLDRIDGIRFITRKFRKIAARNLFSACISVMAAAKSLTVLIDAEAAHNRYQPCREGAATVIRIRGKAPEIVLAQRVEDEDISIHDGIVVSLCRPRDVNDEFAVLIEKIRPRVFAAILIGGCEN
jgi:hypothetical protein